mgnify:CR=1 FL=1
MQRDGGGICSASSSTTWGRFRITCIRATRDAARVGRRGKPEAYYFPPQYNQLDNDFPHTFMGLEPGNDEGRRAAVPRELEQGRQRDPRFSPAPSGSSPARAGRSIPASSMRPVSLVTYEPQVNSDVFAMFQSEVEGRIIDWSLLTKDVPEEQPSRSRLHRRRCSTGTRTSTRSSPSSNRVFPTARSTGCRDRAGGYREQWVCYGTRYYSAKELTVLPQTHRHDSRCRRAAMA